MFFVNENPDPDPVVVLKMTHLFPYFFQEFSSEGPVHQTQCCQNLQVEPNRDSFSLFRRPSATDPLTQFHWSAELVALIWWLSVPLICCLSFTDPLTESFTDLLIEFHNLGKLETTDCNWSANSFSYSWLAWTNQLFLAGWWSAAIRSLPLTDQQIRRQISEL